MNPSPEQRLLELKLILPPAPPPGGLYKPVVIHGNLLFVSGQAPLTTDGKKITGKAGADLDLAAAKLAARQVGLTMLSTLKTHFGSLDRIHRLIKVLGMVNCSPEFTEHPQVINGFSELMADVFGPEKGVGARSAVGMMLPGNIAVEVEAIFEISN